MAGLVNFQTKRFAHALRWCGPLVLSAFTFYGLFQFTQGTQAARLLTVERDVLALERKIGDAQAEHEQFPTRHETEMILGDLKEIKTDLREIRLTLTAK